MADETQDPELSEHAEEALATPRASWGKKKSHHKKKPLEDRTLELMERFFARMEAKGESSSGMTADQFKETLKEVGEAQRKALKPENVEGSYPPVSDFNRSGDYHKPKLRRKTFFVGAQMRNDMLTAREITLFNAINRSMEAEKGRWTAKVVNNGTEQELHVMVPHREASDRMNLPTGMGHTTGLELILMKLIDGEAAIDPSLLSERVAALEAQLAQRGA